MTAQAEQDHPQPVAGRAVAPAKINLFLEILGKREDGFHELETVMVPLVFGDEITFAAAPDGMISLACNHPTLPTDDRNLAVRAAKQLAERCSVSRGVQITLQKNIPLAAGLAGGSTNAAAVLTGLARFWELNVSDNLLHEIAAGLGSDINFFLAHGTAICRGRGEQVEPVANHCDGWVLLVNPGFEISTAWTYRAWSAGQPAPAGSTASVADSTGLCRALADGDLETVGARLYNALETPALRKFPVLELIKQALVDHGAAGALMSGSGATVFGLFGDQTAATAAADAVRREFGDGTWTQITRMTGARQG